MTRGDRMSSFERRERVNALNYWAEHGAETPRPPLQIEKYFSTLLGRVIGPVFLPLTIDGSSESVDFHRELSFLVDAFDQFPHRVDLAFDAVWKAVDSGVKDMDGFGRDMTANLFDLSVRVDDSPYRPAMLALIDNSPQQLWEFVLKHVLCDSTGQAARRLLNPKGSPPEDDHITRLFSVLISRYALDEQPTADQLRKASRLLRLVMRGTDGVEVNGERLDVREVDRIFIYLSGCLYTLRNTRFHGSMPSPFTSSEATLDTFTLPYHAFLSAYFLYLLTAKERGHLPTATADQIGANAVTNLDRARTAMKRHWG